MVRSVPASVARAALLKKGFRPVPKRDHEFFLLFDGEVKTSFFMKISHGTPEVRVDEIRNTVRPHGIRAQDLFQILNCEADAERTLEVWRGRGNR